MNKFERNILSRRRNRFLLSVWVFIVFGGCLFGGQTALVARNNQLKYRDFKIDFSQVKDLPQNDQVIKAVKRQIEIVEQVSLGKDKLKFFKSVPVVMIPDSSGTPGEYKAERNTVFLKARDLASDKPILLHEYLHAYHYLKITDDGKSQIRQFYEAAKIGFPDFKGEYFLTNAREFFAVTASIYLFGNIPRPPFNRTAIKEIEPEYYQYLEKLFQKRTSKSASQIR